MFQHNLINSSNYEKIETEFITFFLIVELLDFDLDAVLIGPFLHVFRGRMLGLAKDKSRDGDSLSSGLNPRRL